MPSHTAAQSATHAGLFAPANARSGPKVAVVAEIGVNHDGRRDRAVELIHAARQAGADAVKLQLFDPRHLLSNQATLAEYQKQSDANVFDMLDRLMLGRDDLLAIRGEARRLGIAFIATPFSLENFDTLKDLHVDAVNLPLIELCSSLGRPMVISTGTADLEELAPAVELLRDRPMCLLHCVSSYPTPTEDATLGALAAMVGRYHVPVGYSDHTDEPDMGAFAVAAGACVIEKHMTWDRNAPGPDHASSFTPAQFADYVAAIRRAQAILGPRRKSPLGVEDEVRTLCRQSVCATRDLDAGHVLTDGDLTVKRPGTGIPAAQLDHVLGQRLARPVHANDLLRVADLA